jgi:N-acetylglutamate synthase/N-acetylornithine aminotransferase
MIKQDGSYTLFIWIEENSKMDNYIMASKFNNISLKSDCATSDNTMILMDNNIQNSKLYQNIQNTL